MIATLTISCGNSDTTTEDAAVSPARADTTAAPSPAKGTTAAPRPTTPQPAAPQLPRGDREIFPRFRVVAHYGTAGTGALGILGEGTPDQAADRVEHAAAPFGADGRPVLPAMELIVTIADPHPGADGSYSHDIDEQQVWRYLKAARAHDQLLVLDIQPGHSDFLSRVRAWEPLLAQPDVGLALDAEWRMPDGGIPGQVIGHVSEQEIGQVADWLADLTARHDLPQKLLVLHQFTGPMIPNLTALAPHPELAIVQHLDGFGSRAAKISKYTTLADPAQFHMGFKLFYTEDIDMFTPAETLQLDPPPEYISYQ